MLKKTFLLLVCVTILLATFTIIKIENQERIVFNVPISKPVKIATTETIVVEQPIGKITIPKIQLDKPLYEKNSEKNNIEENVTVLKESMNPEEENSIIWIAAHSGTSDVAFFNRLDELELQDEIDLEYNDHLYQYQVTSIREQPKDGYIRGKRENKRQLVLTTCCPHKENCQLIINSIEKES